VARGVTDCANKESNSYFKTFPNITPGEPSQDVSSLSVLGTQSLAGQSAAAPCLQGETNATPPTGPWPPSDTKRLCGGFLSEIGDELERALALPGRAQATPSDAAPRGTEWIGPAVCSVLLPILSIGQLLGHSAGISLTCPGTQAHGGDIFPPKSSTCSCCNTSNESAAPGCTPPSPVLFDSDHCSVADGPDDSEVTADAVSVTLQYSGQWLPERAATANLGRTAKHKRRRPRLVHKASIHAELLDKPTSKQPKLTTLRAIRATIDSGCTGSMTHDVGSLINQRPCRELYRAATGAITKVACIGDLPVVAVASDGTHVRFLIRNVRGIPSYKYTLLSVRPWP
jgi:hypothetical protein